MGVAGRKSGEVILFQQTGPRALSLCRWHLKERVIDVDQSFHLSIPGVSTSRVMWTLYLEGP